ncbi:Leucine-rich repeat protein 1 [Fasciolopsis buskii]|uniref:Leucine-rich repeat protein 1 n=1 Tax=Fasciolopsis buskii TaxID=27845 RepID=A0A8E0RSP1_9TREM|nr:Leucine-rich repeat protein 1 [Fasciolopsis buski]
MRITRREDYPIGKSFPPYLTILIARDLGLRALDSRILKLPFLKHLDLGSNSIQSVPDEIQQLSLVQLVLDENQITQWPEIPQDAPLAKSLQSLTLSGNRIAWLPDEFWNMENLNIVILSGIGLQGLPAANLHHVSHLTELQLDRNRLTCLPHALSLHRHCRLSVCDNPFVSTVAEKSSIMVPSLKESASLVYCRNLQTTRLSKLIRTRLPWSMAIQFGVYRPCLRCRKSCGLNPTRILIPFPIGSSLTCDPDNRPSLLAYLCSLQCLQLYQKNAWRYNLM